MHRAINWGLMLATLAAAFALYAIKNDTRRLEARVHAQERALERAQVDVTVLTAERAHLARPARIEPLARSLGLAPITASQYLRLDLNGPDVVPSPLVGEGQGGGDPKASSVVVPPTPNPSPRRVEDAPSARWGGESPAAPGAASSLTIRGR